ncbi:MAG: arginine repressor, partial [Lachnospiraceae bacterium]|nr:arginine repressor [Lachnospiraceae bacterium]
MKTGRQRKILEIINKNDIGTQEVSKNYILLKKCIEENKVSVSRAMRLAGRSNGSDGKATENGKLI